MLAPDAGRPAAPGGLPAQWTSFVGRDHERDAILAALKASRLVGPGGVAKTRLAVEIVREAASSYPSGCAFVDLVPVAEGFVTQAVATLLGVTEEPVGCQNCAAGLGLAFHSLLVFVDEGAEHWPMLGPLAGAVGYGMTGPWREEPHPPFGAA